MEKLKDHIRLPATITINKLFPPEEKQGSNWKSYMSQWGSAIYNWQVYANYFNGSANI